MSEENNNVELTAGSTALDGRTAFATAANAGTADSFEVDNAGTAEEGPKDGDDIESQSQQKGGVSFGGSEGDEGDHPNPPVSVPDVIPQQRSNRRNMFNKVGRSKGGKSKGKSRKTEWNQLKSSRKFVKWADVGDDEDDEEVGNEVDEDEFDTGDARRGIMVTVVDSDEAKPMNPRDRAVAACNTALFGRKSSRNLVGGREEGMGGEHERGKMYKLQAAHEDYGGLRRKILMCPLAFIKCGALEEDTNMSEGTSGLQDLNSMLIDLFYFIFRKGWVPVFVISFMTFYTLVIMGAAFILLAAKVEGNECVLDGGDPLGTNRHKFLGAFSLSWTTFSTVGYGSTNPALVSQHGDGSNCAFITVVTSAMALTGVLFGGFVGAIIFAKVTRITQRASVVFSEALLIQYGSGVDEGSQWGSRINIGNPTNLVAEHPRETDKPSPFPVLEFCIANELHDVAGGEIIQAVMDAAILSYKKDLNDDEDGNAIMKSLTASRAKPKQFLASTSEPRQRRASPTNSDAGTPNGSNVTDELEPGMASLMSKLKGSLAYSDRKEKIDEDTDGMSGARILTPDKLIFDLSEHPFFNRTWNFRHTIDQNSPLLTNTAIQTIKSNGGNWPHMMNTPKKIREAIAFKQIVLSFTGVSNITAAPVFQQHCYDFEDLTIGYKFVSPMYRGEHKKLKVDMELLNDVVEQNIGEGEKLDCKE